MPSRRGPWEVLDSTRKYEHKQIEVFEDKVLSPDGKGETYATIKLRPGVAVLPLDEEGFVYLAREFRYALGRESIEVVGGTINEGEASTTAARRELHEELGIKAHELIDLGRLDPVTSIMDAPTYVFLARGLEFDRKSPDGSEQIETLKLKLDDAVRLVDLNKITHAESCALIFKAGRLISASAEDRRNDRFLRNCR